MTNQSILNGFQLLGFSDDHNLQVLHFVIFLIIYLTALNGNFLIMTAIALDHHLHSPMYFFLSNLSLVDVCYISATVPKSLEVLLTNNKMISYAGCASQIYFVLTCAGEELALLAIMAYDRYVAICHPFHYLIIMNWKACIQMAVASWVTTLIYSLFNTILTFRLSFCGENMIDQFFCDVPQLLEISCSDTYWNQVLMFVIGLSLDSICIILIIISYGYIFSTVMKIPSQQGRHKAFSTCTPQLTVLSIFLIIGIFSYMKPKSLSSPTIDLLSAVLYAVVPPFLNPLIYSLRNNEIQNAIGNIPVKMRNFLFFWNYYARK